jgi:hypothetical protein
MGFFDKFVKKTEVTEHNDVIHNKLTHFKDVVVNSFTNLKQDINVQRQWIVYLNNIHSTLNNAHDKHKALTKKDLNDLKRWINHLNDNSTKHEKNVSILEKNIKQIMVAYNQNFIELHDKINKSMIEEQKVKELIMTDVKSLIKDQSDDMRKKIEEKHVKVYDLIEEKQKKVEHLINEKQDHVKQLIDEKHDKTNKHILEQFDVINEKVKVIKRDKLVQPIEPMIQVNSMQLTNPEQKLINLLMAQADPVSYSLIAEKTGNSINTVRVIMNNLKKKGLVDENVLPSGVKLFSATNKEKIKKLYNIDHL